MGHAQESRSKAKKSKAAATREEDDAAKPKPRLPNHYGKLDLTDTQRTKILDIRTRYRADIDRLRAQLAELRASETDELEAVLTKDQKTRLSELQASSRKRRAARALEDDEPAGAQKTKSLSRSKSD
jgi:Spy/CpxP family protein refolding chaperone